MKTKFLLALSICFFIQARAQQQYINWVNTWDVNGTVENCMDIEVDSLQNAYALFNNALIGTNTKSVVFKYDSTGSIVYSIPLGNGLSGNYVEATGLVLDAANNVFITGRIKGTVDFNPAADSANTVTSTNYKTFLAKYDTLGNYTWVYVFANNGSDTQANTIGIDEAQNIYLSGWFYNSVDVDFDSVDVAQLTSPGTNIRCMYLIKYNNDGDYKWSRQFCGVALWNLATDQSIDIQNGAIYIAGYYDGTVNFGTFNDVYLSTVNSTDDVFLAKYDTAGNYVWVKSMGGTQNDFAVSNKIDTYGNIYISGTFNDTVNFNTTGITNLVAAPGGPDIYIAKYAPDGSFLWAKSIDGALSFENQITTDKEGSVYIIGSFNEFVIFEPGVQIPGYSSTVFFSKYNSNGNYQWAKNFGNTNYTDRGQRIAVARNKTYVGGAFGMQVNFDLEGDTFNLTTLSSSNAFIAQYSSTPFTPVPPDTPADILTFTLPQQVAPATINPIAKTVDITIANNANPGALTPTITISANATMLPQTNTTQNFSTPFTYVVTAEDGLNSNNWVVTVHQTIGVNQSASSSIKIYPNPAQNILMIEMPGMKTKEQFILTDITGKVVLSYMLTNYKTAINLHELSSGMYLWRIAEKAGKLIVE